MRLLTCATIAVIACVFGFAASMILTAVTDNSELHIRELNGRITESLAAGEEKQKTIDRLTAEVETLRVKADANVAAKRATELEAQLAAEKTDREAAEKASAETVKGLRNQLTEQTALIAEINKRIPAKAGSTEFESQTHGYMTCKNVRVRDRKILGVIENDCGEDCRLVTCSLTVYDAAGELVDVVNIALTNIDNGDEKPFDSYMDEPFPAGGYFEFKFESSVK